MCNVLAPAKNSYLQSWGDTKLANILPIGSDETYHKLSPGSASSGIRRLLYSSRRSVIDLRRASNSLSH
jgi:hypothetical protein